MENAPPIGDDRMFTRSIRVGGAPERPDEAVTLTVWLASGCPAKVTRPLSVVDCPTTSVGKGFRAMVGMVARCGTKP